MTHTHVGAKPNVTYQCRGRLYGHSSPVAGKRHALNVGEYLPRCGTPYVSLCGEKVWPQYESECGQYTIRDHVQAAGAKAVTCKRCLAFLARLRTCRYCGVQSPSKVMRREGKDNCLAHACKDVAGCGERIRSKMSPEQLAELNRSAM